MVRGGAGWLLMLDEHRLIVMVMLVCADAQMHREGVGLRNFITGLQHAVMTFEVEHLPGAIRPAGLDDEIGRRQCQATFRPHPEARRNAGFKYLEGQHALALD